MKTDFVQTFSVSLKHGFLEIKKNLICSFRVPKFELLFCLFFSPTDCKIAATPVSTASC